MIKLVIPLAEDIFPQSATKANLSVTDPFERKMCESGTVARDVKGRKGFTLFISNEDQDNIKIVKWPENSGLIIDGVNETVNDQIKTKKAEFLLLWCHISFFIAWLLMNYIWKVG